MMFKGNPTVLLVDDEPVGIKILEMTLQREGYKIFTAHNGPDARRLAAAKRPDIILLDVMMPGEDGFEMIDSLNTDPKTANIPVIFLTGRDELESKIKGFDLGAVDYITKPFQGREVVARVRLHLKLSLATNSMIASQANKLRQIKKAQKSMLTRPDKIPDARFGVLYRSLLEAGGDFYDVFKISDKIFGYFVADISGHDIETSYITAALKALLKQNCIPIYKPVESMLMINNILKELLPQNKYLTACYARLNRKTRRMSIVNGGHPPAVYLPKGGSPRFVDIKGDVIGIFKDVCFETTDIAVNEGDRFFLYSDGLIERPCERKVWAGCLDYLLAMCDGLRDIPINESAKRLSDMILRDSVTVKDDIVILGIEV